MYSVQSCDFNQETFKFIKKTGKNTIFVSNGNTVLVKHVSKFIVVKH